MPMALPQNRQYANPSSGLVRSQPIVDSGSVADARKPLPAQAQAFPQRQAVPKTASPANATRPGVPISVSVSVSLAGSAPVARQTPNATPRSLPQNRQSATPSSGLARTQATAGSGSVAGAQRSPPAQAQVIPKSQVVARPAQNQNQTLARPRAMITSPSGAVAATTQNQYQNQVTTARPRLVQSSAPMAKGRMMNSTSSHTNTTTTTGRNVYGGTPSGIKAVASPAVTRTQSNFNTTLVHAPSTGRTTNIVLNNATFSGNTTFNFSSTYYHRSN
ncbi:hypothetical protein DXG01_011618 [Tephrocybe rancida]|nr:hypothetical protein DXG01_011618 [Tephrocybe rancida]